MKLGAKQRLMAERETGLGAGTTFMARDTGRFLFLKRSDQGDEPGTWCNCGGGVEAGETPEQAAKREAVEEIGYSEPYDLIPMDVNTQPDGFTYHNFFSIVPTEFEPVLNDEHTDFKWSDTMPDPMHPEYEAALMRWHAQNVGAEPRTKMNG
jgi:8-oxo-dGTP pyrophosphatase MutT (NUDIX family)